MRFRSNLKKWLYGRCPFVAGSFPYYGVKVYFPQDSFLFNLVCQYGIYEKFNIQLLEKLISPNTFYFDVGANIGLMSVPILKSCVSSKVVSFEASPNSLSYLLKTAENSNLKHRWNIIQKAVSSEVGSLDFSVRSPKQGAFDGFRDTERGGVSKQITVPVTTIDTEWEAMGSPNVSIIKIDVEGSELDVLKGAMVCIQQNHPYILCEWNARNLKAYNCPIDSILSFCEQIDYQVLNTPEFIPVTNIGLLKTYMKINEYFLLIPKH